MFEPEQAISDWRREMKSAGIKTPATLHELENHLREEIKQQLKLEPNEQQAFQIAVRQIGLASALRREFAKNEIKVMKHVVLKGLGIFGILTGTALIIPMLAILKQCKLNHEYIFDHHTSTVMLLLAGVLMVAFGVRTTLQGFKRHKA